MGIINVGGNGSVVVEETTYELGFKDALYIGSGNKEIIFKSSDSKILLNSTSIQLQPIQVIQLKK